MSFSLGRFSNLWNRPISAPKLHYMGSRVKVATKKDENSCFWLPTTPKGGLLALQTAQKAPNSTYKRASFLLFDQEMTMLAYIDPIYDSVRVTWWTFLMPSYRANCFQVARTHKSWPGHSRTCKIWPIWPHITAKLEQKRLLTKLREQSERIVEYFGINNVIIGSCHMNNKVYLMQIVVSDCQIPQKVACWP